jgi:hypothetical protein
VPMHTGECMRGRGCSREEPKGGGVRGGSVVVVVRHYVSGDVILEDVPPVKQIVVIKNAGACVLNLLEMLFKNAPMCRW